jgi:cell wall-associated NlpC family hydrolase
MVLLLPAELPAQPTATPTGAASLALAAQTSLLEAAGRYQQIEQAVVQRRQELDLARTADQKAAIQVAADRDVVGSAARALYLDNPAQRDPRLGLDVAQPNATQDVLYRAALSAVADDHREELVAHAQRSAAAVTLAARQVAEARTALTAAQRRAAAALATVRGKAAGLSPAVTAQLAGLATDTTPASQQERDRTALHRWQAYLAGLAAAGLTPPPARQLDDPRQLPAGMSPALDANRQPIPGVAWAVIGNTPVTVLPAETVTAVSTAMAQLGKPYVAGAAGPGTYDCGGLTSSSWLLAGYALPLDPAAQWAGATTVPTDQLEPGDLVFTDGGLDVGLYLGAGDVLGASAATGRVGVRSLSDRTDAVRVSLGAPSTAHPALTPAAGLSACGAALPAPAAHGPSPSPADAAWGGWSNGQIPNGALCPVAPGQQLRCDAAAAYRAMSDAYDSAFGRPLCITDSYRSLSAQVDAHHRKPGITAVPGTSNHGWGLAVDLCGGINSFGTAQAGWMEANAGRFGWVHPRWAQLNGANPEPWHWEFGHIS